MKLSNLDSLFNQAKLDQLFHMLRNEDMSEKAEGLIQHIHKEISDSIHAYHDLKFAIDNSTTITMTNRNGIITYVDDHFCDLTQYKKTELIGKSHRMIKSGHHDKLFFTDMWKKLLSGQVWNGEIKNKKRDGSFFWVETTIVPLLKENGQPYAYIAFRTNITKRKEMEEKLVDALQNDFRRTVNALVNLVFKVKVNEKGQYYFTLFEGKLAQTIGLNAEDIEKKLLNGIFDDEKAAFLAAQYKQAFKGETVTYKHKYNNHYLFTSLSPVEENGEIIEVIGSAVDITKHEESELRILHMAYHDFLTDLPNRRKLTEDLKQLIQQANSSERSFAVLFCDLDRFKYINDALGHSAGDQVISTIADRILEVIEYQGELYRLGGDEFIVLSYYAQDQNTTRRLASDILAAIEKPMKIMGEELFITSSIGISHYPDDATSGEQLIKYADMAMHFCKMNGRHGVLVYTPEMNHSYQDLLKLEVDLRHALNHEQLMLYYQPKVDIMTGKVKGAEALIRWNHPQEGFISPGKFIPVAEETGLIVQIGEWVLREACNQNMYWVEQGFAPQKIAVNISAIELQRQDFVFKVKQIIKETGISPEYLELEITENGVMQNTEDTIETMAELRSLGISLSIDDFGTGYSSLSYLRRFPINYLKIDQSFIRDVLEDSSDAEIVKAMIQLAHTYNLKVVAEGVEEREILDFLFEQSCDLYQGYYYSKPLDPIEYEQYLERQYVHQKSPRR